MKKIAFVSSEKPEAKEALKILKREYKNVPPINADIIVALGGDGTILKSLHDFLKQRKPIYGMNKGNVGFLMNQYSENDLHKRLEEAVAYPLYPLIRPVSVIPFPGLHILYEADPAFEE